MKATENTGFCGRGRFFLWMNFVFFSRLIYTSSNSGWCISVEIITKGLAVFYCRHLNFPYTWQGVGYNTVIGWDKLCGGYIFSLHTLRFLNLIKGPFENDKIFQVKVSIALIVCHKISIFKFKLNKIKDFFPSCI